MDIHINTDEKIQIDYLTLQKMAFLFNALEDGWQIRKSKEKYIRIHPNKIIWSLWYKCFIIR